MLIDTDGRILLRKPKREFDGYVWTFAKGRPSHDELPEEAALREVREECGVNAEIVGKIPGEFVGGTSHTIYFLMRPIETGYPIDDETEEVRWVDVDQARKLISLTRNKIGRERDLAVLEAALAAKESEEYVEL